MGKQGITNYPMQTMQPTTQPMLNMPDTDEETFIAIGVGSVQSDDRHAIFLDLDGYDKKECESIAREVINKVGVSDCYIAQSSPGNHHLVSLSLIDFKRARRIARAYAHAAWTKFRGVNEDFVLRVSPKFKVSDGKLIPVEGTTPELVSIIKSPFSYYEKSNSLRRIFRNVWNYNIPKDTSFNDDSAFRLHVFRIRMTGATKRIEFGGAG